MNLQKKQYFIVFFGLMRINPRSYVSPFTMENQGYVVLYEKLFDLIFFIILKTFFMFVFVNLNYLEIGIMRHERSDKH